MYKVILPGLLGFALTACSSTTEHAASRPTTCQPITEAQVAALFERWNTSLQSGEPQQVVTNYAPRSLLLPTLSSQARFTREEKLAYFENFLQGHPSGRIDKRQIHLGCNMAVDAGQYTFSLSGGRQVPARYTFTYGWDGTQWLITTHHSSLMPDEAARPD